MVLPLYPTFRTQSVNATNTITARDQGLHKVFLQMNLPLHVLPLRFFVHNGYIRDIRQHMPIQERWRIITCECLSNFQGFKVILKYKKHGQSIHGGNVLHQRLANYPLL